uniref:EexN family lipoprotein n=1 Tax=Scandinavium goeteborgense TaxID=1851514 RepID=UPI0013579E65|nr:EexN family lipoprotein [Scandinavium goeteborgense]
MKKLTFAPPLILSLIFLNGCDEKYSREWFIKHHDEMISKYTECLLERSWSDQICQNAKNAMTHEKDKPDVIEGRKKASAKLDAQIKSEVKDFNTKFNEYMSEHKN